MDWFPDPMKPLSEKSSAELATEAWLYDEMMGGDDATAPAEGLRSRRVFHLPEAVRHPDASGALWSACW